MLPTYSSSSSRSDRLGHPWYHQNRARTLLGQKPKNTWKHPDQSSLHNFAEQAALLKVMQTFISSEDNPCAHAPKALRRGAKPGYLQLANILDGDALCATLQPHSNSSRPQQAQGPNMVELNGIEPLTPCLQSRCSPS